MAGFNPKDYVDVAERVRIFNEKYPEGSLQSELTRTPEGWLCKAYAYRDPADERPGVGHAFEPVPGKTTFTKDSEAMNAETSAWGRAIVALGFPTKKIASTEEVRNRQGGNGEKAKPREAAPKPAAAKDDPPPGHSSAEDVEGLTASILAAAEIVQVLDSRYPDLVAGTKRAIERERKLGLPPMDFRAWLVEQKRGMEELAGELQAKAGLVEA